jgi:hypothetical protein
MPDDLSWSGHPSSRQMRTFTPIAAMHKYTAWPTTRRSNLGGSLIVSTVMASRRNWPFGAAVEAIGGAACPRSRPPMAIFLWRRVDERVG